MYENDEDEEARELALYMAAVLLNPIVAAVKVAVFVPFLPFLIGVGLGARLLAAINKR